MLRIFRPEKKGFSADQEEGKSELFDQEDFFRTVETRNLKTKEEDKKFEPGKIEWFIVEYFERFVFWSRPFVYKPEYKTAIFELLRRNQDKLASFSEYNGQNKNTLLSPDKQVKYLTLVNPNFRSTDNLNRSMQDYEIALRRELNSIKNKLRNLLTKKKK